MSTIRKEYEYKSKWTVVFLGGGFFGLGTVLFVFLAITHDGGLIVSGISLSQFGAQVFFWILAGLSLSLVLGAAYVAYVRLTTTQRIAVTADGILLPAGRWTSRERHVPFHSITGLEIVKVARQVFLYVHADGERYTVVKGMLPHKGDFDDMVSLLQAEAALE